jgi:CRISPR/Cas system-associated exonuclease Cas4 (RecB family)
LTLSADEVSTMISSYLFEAYLECPTKCWLRSQNEPSTGNVYAEWRRAQNESYRKEWLERRPAIVADADRILSPPFEADRKEATWRFAGHWRSPCGYDDPVDLKPAISCPERTCILLQTER